MSSSSVEKIKERLDVADVIGTYVKLEKAGANFKGKCPFHNEKTPSFFVSPDRGSYYCFGCGAKGDIFTFVQEFEGLDFMGALKELAGRAGVELEQVSLQNKAQGDELKDVLERAARWFEERLPLNKKVEEYLTGRGITPATRTAWRLGYAPLEWRALSELLYKEGFSEATLTKAGLIKKSDAAGSPYDVFRGRIIFPIFDPSGRVIAFSGRIFDEQPDAPKYLNSPETDVFVKSETLYGLDRAKTHIRKKGYSILVEGQFDLILCHQEGFENAVATSGTALTVQHLERLARLSPKIMMVFDGDSAGVAAAQKSGELALTVGMEAKLALLPDGKDPADMLSLDKEGFTLSLRNAKHIIEFGLDQILLETTDARTVGRKVKEKVLPLVRRLQSSIEQSHFISQIAKKTGIKEEAIWTDLRQIRDKDVNESAIVIAVEKETKKKSNYITRRLWGIIEWQSKTQIPFIDPKHLKDALEKIVGKERLAHIEDEYRPQAEEIIFEAESYYGTKEALEKDLDELLINFEEDVVRDELVSLMKQLQEAEQAKDQSAIQKIHPRLSELIKKKNELSVKRKDL